MIEITPVNDDTIAPLLYYRSCITVEAFQKRRKYDDAFKQQALQMMRMGQSVPSIALALGVGESLLYKWKQALQPAAQDQELKQVRSKLKQVEIERDILKKALSIFCRPT
ncbi:MAG: transposase [Acidobacteria bacterium]|nr:transposase [Acidobacteriota bacterium]MBI3423345.1 transposase [Acidobacteriota bacterium]